MEAALKSSRNSGFRSKLNERIELRLIEAQDAQVLFRLFDSNREHLRPWHPWVDDLRSVGDVEKKIWAWGEQHATNRGFCAGIWFDGQLCGAINHQHVDLLNRWVALSYWLDASHQGQGIMTACCRALVVHGFKVWNLNRITIECATENVRSRAIPERLGFKLEGIVRGVERLNDHYADHAIYGLLRSECQWLSAIPTISNADNAMNLSKPGMPDGRLDDSFAKSLKLAFEMQNAGRTEEAEALCRVLVQVHPTDAQLLFLLGMILHQMGQEQEAILWLSLAAQSQPHSARIFEGLGCAYQKLGNHALAAEAFERAIKLEPRSAATCYNLGNTCYQLDQVERAASLFQQVVGINPHDRASWNNLGNCFKELNRLDDSNLAYNHVVEIAPDYALGHYGRAITLLTSGQLVEGFREYEWRLKLAKARPFSQPAWKGEPAPGKTLLLHAEQGFGDAIQMLRFIPVVRKRVGRVILECRRELQTLLQYSKCADAIIPYGAPIPTFDCFLPLLSLPHILKVELDTIPNSVPYLRSPIGKPLPFDQVGHLKVGLVWAGNPEHHQDAARSIPLEELAPILQVSGVSFYSLQQPVPVQDAHCLRSKSDVIYSGLTFADFLDTASVIGQLDLVITVDTAVAHLAGALGKPVWTLIQHSPNWRWFLDRTDTPWYPTMQLYRQAERHRWDLPVKRIAAALECLSASNSFAAGTVQEIQPNSTHTICVGA